MYVDFGVRFNLPCGRDPSFRPYVWLAMHWIPPTFCPSGWPWSWMGFLGASILLGSCFWINLCSLPLCPLRQGKCLPLSPTEPTRCLTITIAPCCVIATTLGLVQNATPATATTATTHTTSTTPTAATATATTTTTTTTTSIVTTNCYATTTILLHY